MLWNGYNLIWMATTTVLLIFLKSLGETIMTLIGHLKKSIWTMNLWLCMSSFSFVWQILLNLDFVKSKMTWFFFFGHLVTSTGLLSFVWRFSLVAQMVKNLPTMQETRVWFLGCEDPLEKGMTTLFSILAWNIPWIEELGRLQSMRLQRVGHYWATNSLLFVMIDLIISNIYLMSFPINQLSFYIFLV